MSAPSIGKWEVLSALGRKAIVMRTDRGYRRLIADCRSNGDIKEDEANANLVLHAREVLEALTNLLDAMVSTRKADMAPEELACFVLAVEAVEAANRGGK